MFPLMLPLCFSETKTTQGSKKDENLTFLGSFLPLVITELAITKHQSRVQFSKYPNFWIYSFQFATFVRLSSQFSLPLTHSIALQWLQICIPFCPFMLQQPIYHPEVRKGYNITFGENFISDFWIWAKLVLFVQCPLRDDFSLYLWYNICYKVVLWLKSLYLVRYQ